MDCSPTRALCPWDAPGKNTGVGCHALLQRIFLPGDQTHVCLRLLHRRRILYPVGHLGSSGHMRATKQWDCDGRFGGRVKWPTESDGSVSIRVTVSRDVYAEASRMTCRLLAHKGWCPLEREGSHLELVPSLGPAEFSVSVGWATGDLCGVWERELCWR